MKFSDAYSIKRTAKDDWFDVLLSTDTRLFVDPFRIYVDSDKRWQKAHDRLVAFFNIVLKQVARAGKDENSAHWKAAQRLLRFPEPSEFCLGFGDTPLGAGTGEGLQSGVLYAARETIQLGITAVEHFEELALFEEGIGADRISDIVCNVLKHEFIVYTQDVVNRHQIPTTEIAVPHASWNEKFETWVDDKVHLPLNPFTGKAVLLTPARFLRKLPTVEPADFWNWSWTNENEQIRGQFNYDLGKNVDAKTIARFARVNAELAKRYVASLEKTPKPPYDLEKDPAGDVSWYPHGLLVAEALAYKDLPKEAKQFCDWVESLLNDFAHNIGEQDGWRILWDENTDKPRNERYAQALLRTVLWQICKANDIDFTGEPNAGRGPCDFKFSKGWVRRALTEVKPTNNSRYWHGLTEQTPQYMKSEQIHCGFFLSIGFGDKDFEKDRQDAVKAAAKAVSDDLGVKMTPIFVDGRKKQSASKAKAGNNSKGAKAKPAKAVPAKPQPGRTAKARPSRAKRTRRRGGES